MPIPDDVQATLVELADEFIEAKDRLNAAKKDVDRLGSQIRAITDRYSLPVVEGKSEYIQVPDRQMSVRVTRSGEPPQVVNLGRFLETMPPEVIWRVIGQWLLKTTVPESGFDMEQWRLCLTEELVSEDRLVPCIEMSSRKKPVDSLTAVRGVKDENLEDY